MKEEKLENVPVDQHYVPRCYLKNFATATGKEGKEKVLTSFYQFDKSLCKSDIPTKSICYKSYFYGEDGILENDFRLRETRWSILLNDILHMKEYRLTSEQENQIREFVVFQYLRTAALHDFSKDAAKTLLMTHLSNTFDVPMDDDTLRSVVSDNVEKDLRPNTLVEMAENLLPYLDDLGIAILQFETESKLITSDAPVIPLNPFSISSSGFSLVGAFLILPVSPDKMVILYDKKLYKQIGSYMVIENEEDVSNLNKFQVVNAEERIIAKSLDELNSAISDHEVLDRRNEFRMQLKVQSRFDGQGTAFAVHARCVKFTYGLSFAKLPKCIMKMPLFCRLSFAREYSKRAWITLLVQMTRMPQIIKSERNLSETEMKEVRKGFSELRKYMEDYWEMPLQERTISSDLARKLQTVPLLVDRNLR